MAQERVERRLTAILAADVVGYSRLMGVDEEGTLAALKMLRREVADPKIKEHRGRIVHTTGDGLLGEFASVVDAVRCAVEVQREMAARNADVPAERRVDFRIGINLGDIIIDEDDIFGDGVNVAARLEALAEPGGICVSRVVRDQVRDKLAVSFEDMGEQQVKNIARPVRAYRILFAEWAGVPPILPDTAPRPLPDRPSIAVLPFKNVSGDPEQEYFVDGITEDIITALSKWRWFLVIARNSTFAYKGKSVGLQEVSRDLGVRYILEGSMRRVEQRVRITSQLIDIATSTHLWAERYDRDLTDIFAVQDDITSRVAAAIEPALSRAESQRVIAKRPEHMGAWDYCQRGFWHVHKGTRTDGMAGSLRLVQTGAYARSQPRRRSPRARPRADRAMGLRLGRGLRSIRPSGTGIRPSGCGVRQGKPTGRIRARPAKPLGWRRRGRNSAREPRNRAERELRSRSFLS